MKTPLYIFLFFAWAMNGVAQTIQYDVDTARANIVYTVVEVMPEPVGGFQAFQKCVENNVIVPATFQSSTPKKCFVKFIVEKDGSISHLEIAKGIVDCSECDKEAIKVFNLCGNKWSAGMQNGVPVRVALMTQIKFGFK